MKFNLNILSLILSTLWLTVKRLWTQRAMTAVTTLGLMTVVAIIMVVPLYADAVSFRVLEQELRAASGESARPPFAYMFNYIGAWRGPLNWETVQPADAYLMGEASVILGMPRELAVHHLETDLFQIFPTETADYDEDDFAISQLNFATTTAIEENITIVEGRLPAPVNDPAAPVEVMITQPLADATGLQSGEQYTAFSDRDGRRVSIPVVIAGIWQATNASDDFWFFRPAIFDEHMLVPEETLLNKLVPALENEINFAVWYWVMDGSRIGTQDVDRLLNGISRIERELQVILPNASTFLAPTDALRAYRISVDELSALLLAFNVPTIGLVLAFVILVGTLTANRRRNEFAVLRSRGATSLQVIAIALAEAIVIAVLALILGAIVALVLTQGVGHTRSFMNFTVESPLRVALTGAALRGGVAAVILAIVAQIVPVITTSRQTIISYKLSQARWLQAPWWQRAWLDILLLAITVYGFYTLNQQGSIIAQSVAGDPVQNPLLFWLPALTILAVALLALRLLPQIMRLITTLLAQVNGVTLLQAARYLARTPQQYDMPLLLLIMTVSFSVFTASLARTLDYDLYDRHFYAVGADLNLYTPPNVPGAPGAAGQAATDEASFVFLPISEYETIDGVAEAARVGSYPARARVGEEISNVTFMGIEPHDFAHTAYWRWDFSPSRLGTLMNALGTATEGVLVPQEFLRANGLRGGDIMRLTVRLEGTEFDVERRIVGVFDHFPTWYPETDAPLIVGNLNTLFEEVGSQFPYRVWLELNEPLDEGALRLALNERQLFGSVWAEPQSDIEQAFLQPERQGLFGLLSVGFMAAAILTVMGLLLYAVFSYRQRLVTLGVLRAVGLSVGSMMRLVAWELALLIFAGIVLGTAFGIGLSRAFIPYLQLGTAEGIVLPPFVVEIAWGAVSQVYVLFAVMFMVSLVTLVLLARRMRLFMVIKLGESV